MIALCCPFHTKHINTHCGQNAEFLNITPGGGGPGVAQSVQRLATGWTVRGSNPPVRARFSAPVQTGPGTHTASCTMGTRSFPGVKCGRGVKLIPHPLLVPWSRKGRTIPLLPLWDVRPVQSLSACTRVHFTFTPGGKHINHCSLIKG